eukprot:SAG11_NODE_6878_length_1232_cov_1.894086_2_plen_65_part_00
MGGGVGGGAGGAVHAPLLQRHRPAGQAALDLYVAHAGGGGGGGGGGGKRHVSAMLSANAEAIRR